MPGGTNTVGRRPTGLPRVDGGDRSNSDEVAVVVRPGSRKVYPLRRTPECQFKEVTYAFAMVSDL